MSMDADNRISTPEDQASERPGKGGVVPPPEHRFQPGQSGNPNGRPTFGATVREWANHLQDAESDELQRIVRDKRQPSAKTHAALRVLRGRLVVDAAEFEPVIRGEKTLEQLNREGVDTSVVKKITRREGKDGVQVSLEFHDWSGAEFDRLMDRTSGKPHQTSTVTHQEQRTAPQLLEEARRLAGIEVRQEQREPGDN